jgi:hypothetical protein
MTETELTALLDRLEELEQAATSGEWRFNRGVLVGISDSIRQRELGVPALVLTLSTSQYGWPEVSDANLITESRNALPILIRELRARLGSSQTRGFHGL